jgi:hypothetical protein
MGNKLQRITSPIRALLPNAGWDSAKYLTRKLAKWAGEAGVITFVLRLLSQARGIPQDIWIDAGVFVFSFLLFAIAYLLGRKGRKSAEVPTPIQPSAATAAIANEAEGGRMAAIAQTAASNIEFLVLVLSCEAKNFNLEPENLPFVEFIVTVFNASVHNVSVRDGVTGRAIYREYPLEKEPHISENDAKALEYGRRGTFKLRQGLSKDECELIRKFTRENPDQYYYTDLDIRGVNIEFSFSNQVGETQTANLNMPTRIKLPFAEPVKLIAASSEGLPSEKQCSAKRLHAIADADAENIRNAVVVRGIDFRNEIQEGRIPYIEFKFAIFNMSVYEISIDDSIHGYIRFDKEMLTQHKEISSNSAINCPVRFSGCYFTIYQRLTKEEADYIMKSSDDKSFRFDGLITKITGGADSPNVKPGRLKIDGLVSRKYPRWVDYGFF